MTTSSHQPLPWASAQVLFPCMCLSEPCMQYCEPFVASLSQAFLMLHGLGPWEWGRKQPFSSLWALKKTWKSYCGRSHMLGIVFDPVLGPGRTGILRERLLQRKRDTFHTHEDLLHPSSIAVWLVLRFHLMPLGREEHESAV